MGIHLESSGTFDHAIEFLSKVSDTTNHVAIMNEFGELGVQALKDASPIDTGLMASSWRYEIKEDSKSISLIFHNDDIENGCNVAILVDTGHMTKRGYYVEGRDFINPALQPIFDGIAEKAWREVMK